MNIDMWQLAGTIAAVAFTVGFVDQARVTFQTKDVNGLSLVQWCVFLFASTIFAAYYTHLEQYMMASVSGFGSLCCLSIVAMLLKYKNNVLNTNK